MSPPCFNFNAGPAAMPLPVLESLQRDLIDYRGRGLSVLEMSHRSEDFINIARAAESDLRVLLNVPEDYAVLFMQGGASAQFALTINNLDSQGEVAFASTGYWSRKAIAVAEKYTRVRVVTDDGASLYEKNTMSASGGRAVSSMASVPAHPEPISIPSVNQWLDASDSSYLHITDNETIDGIVLNGLPKTSVPIVVDMSSSILSRPIDVSQYGLIYAGAQKNIGPAGITVVIIRKDLLERSEQTTSLAPVFSYAAMHRAESMLNTPPTFAWYAAGLVFKWLRDEGGLQVVAQRNERQARAVYSTIDKSDVYINRIDPKHRSIMNIPFQLSNPQWQQQFLLGASERGLVGLKGHKSVGGLRASLYNAVTDESVDALIDYLEAFQRKLPS